MSRKRRQAQEALADSEERYRRMVETANEGIWSLDRQLKTTYVNQKMADLLGYSIHDMLGKSFWEFLPAEDREDEARRREAGAHGIVGKHEYRFLAADGSERWMLVSASSLRNDQNENLGSFAMLTDITERKQAEQAVRDSAEKLRNIVEHSTNLYYSHTPDHRLTYLSPQTRDILDCEPEEALVSWTDLITDNPINQIGFEHTRRAIETGEPQPPYELELVGLKGRRVWVEVREAPLVEDGKTKAIVGALVDITERKQAEAALRESEERYRTLFETAHDAIFVVENGVFVDANPRAMQMFGLTDDDISRIDIQSLSSECQPDGWLTVEAVRDLLKAELHGKTHSIRVATPHAKGSGVRC